VRFGDTLSYAGKYSYWDHGFGDTNPSPRSFPFGIRGYGETLHWRLSSLETIVLEAIVTETE